MFTGIVTALGTVRAIEPLGGGKDMRLVIAASSGAFAHGAGLDEVYQDARAYDAQFASARYALEAGREALPWPWPNAGLGWWTPPALAVRLCRSASTVARVAPRVPVKGYGPAL